EALRSFELRGLVRLEPTLPYTFDQCEAYTREIIANVGKEHTALGPRHAFLLERLTKQFVGLRDRPEDRWSKPVHTVREDDRFFATDFQVGGVLERKPDREKGEMDGLFNPDFLLGLGHNVTMETDYRVTLAPEWEANAGGVKASARVKSFRGLTAEFERALLDAGGSWWDVHLGREYAHWGPNLREDLILSRTAGSLDQLGGRITLGRYALSMIQATLYDGDPNQRYLAGHRLTVALPRGAFLGLSETALYAHRDLDYKYLLPLGIFYAEQANEGSNDDNILWALDCKVPLHRGVMLYGQFLVDDFQYQRGSGAGPDRLGFYWAADALFMVWGREMEVSGGSTFVNRFTYGHSGGTQYVAGDGGVRMNPLLGSPMGPDAARDFIKATLGVSSRASLTLEGVRTIYGAGGVLAQGRLLDWIPGTDAGPDFSIWAPALYVKYASVSLRYDLNHGSYVSAGAWVWYRDEDEINLHRKDNLGWLELVLDL
ncbi:MAG TPA: hypothetical protein VMT60_02025, partial [Candidatus Bathyarchaeia archaeon]|nr:hypothetical protein [Candidatus Bathyarchaeia archaeon]